MKTIPQENIKSINVKINKDARLVIKTAHWYRSRKNKHLISFGVAHLSEFEAPNFYIDGERLLIDTEYNEKGRYYIPKPSEFEITLPQDCTLTFTFIDP